MMFIGWKFMELGFQGHPDDVFFVSMGVVARLKPPMGFHYSDQPAIRMGSPNAFFS